MALWLVRAGKFGQHEQRFLESNRVYATWTGFNHDLRKAKTRQEGSCVTQLRCPTSDLVYRYGLQLFQRMRGSCSCSILYIDTALVALMPDSALPLLC